MKFPQNLSEKLKKREQLDAVRHLSVAREAIDFSSNDYLGFARSTQIYADVSAFMHANKISANGSTGSRLLSGNHKLYQDAELILAKFHRSESALLFNSGYDANIGLFSSVPQRGDIVFYDEFSHASIRDGISLNKASSYKFKHNDINDLKEKFNRLASTSGTKQNTYVVTESVFSMDGDSLDLRELADFCVNSNCYLIVDEAHALGVFGENGSGLVQELKLENKVFARVNTFGKSLGCHGAVILGSAQLTEYLLNYARSFIYTTGLPPHSVASILVAYQYLQNTSAITALQSNIDFFNKLLDVLALKDFFLPSQSAIHSCVLSGNDAVKSLAQLMQKQGFDVKPILSPTVPAGKERLRLCLHAYNTHEQIFSVLSLLKANLQA